MKNIHYIKIKIDLTKFELPDYEYSVEQLADEAGTTCDQVVKTLGLDPEKIDEYDTVKTEPVKKKTLNQFKSQLIGQIKEDLRVVIDQYIGGDLEQPSLDEAIDEIGNEVYTDCDDLSGECSDGVKIEVL